MTPRAPEGRLRWGDLFRVFLRLLFLQGLLNSRGLQNIGLASALSPASKRLANSGDNSLLLKHLEYFNTNPNFAPLIVGGVLKLEEERLSGKPITDNDIDYFKRALASPFAAMGDMLFVGYLKPLALTCGCIFAIYKSLIGLLAVFLLYNGVVISCRLWGVYFGHARGWGLVEFFSGPEFQRVLGVVQGVCAGVGGVLLAVLWNDFNRGGRWVPLLAGALVLIALFLFKKNVPASWFAIILFPASVLFALVFR